MSILSKFVDERFLNHRLRSTSIAGQAGAALAAGLFAYRYFADHVWSWDLLAVGAAIGAVKLAILTWYLFSE